MEVSGLYDVNRSSYYLLPVLAHMISLSITAVKGNKAGVASIRERVPSGGLCSCRHDVLNQSSRVQWENHKCGTKIYRSGVPAIKKKVRRVGFHFVQIQDK